MHEVLFQTEMAENLVNCTQYQTKELNLTFQDIPPLHCHKKKKLLLLFFKVHAKLYASFNEQNH